MLTNEQQFVLDTIRQSIRPDCDCLSNWKEIEFDVENIILIISQQGILLTVYPVLSDFPVLMEALNNQYYAELAHAVTQDYEGMQVLQQLNRGGYDSIGLKGWEMRRLYPKILMRQMADIDILVRPYNYQAIVELMIEIGYTADTRESSWMHDNFIKGDIKVEMHKRLSDDSGQIRNWEKNMWRRSIPSDDSDCILRMSDEDYFIFHIIHMHKDFLYGSLGLRRIVDTWLLKNTYANMDWDYIHTEFERMDLQLFAERMIALSKAAMGETEMDEMSEIMLEHAFQYGIYGNGKTYKLARIASMSDTLRNGKLRSLLTAVFLPYKRMRAHFPILDKWPILLPWFWTIRISQQLRNNLQKKIKLLDYQGLNEEDFAQMKTFFKAGGVDNYMAKSRKNMPK